MEIRRDVWWRRRCRLPGREPLAFERGIRGVFALIELLQEIDLVFDALAGDLQCHGTSLAPLPSTMPKPCCGGDKSAQGRN